LSKNINLEELVNIKSYDEMTELDENLNYTNACIAKEGIFKDYSILIGQFYYENEDFYNGFLMTAANELEKFGFIFDIVYSEDEFSQIL